jgi:hypothetical protein
MRIRVSIRLPWAALVIVSLLSSAKIHADDVVPANPELRWWKGNLHTHSLWSDGNDFPEMIAEWYRTHGYNFLALSDHNVLSQGMRWMKLADIQKRQAPVALERYRERFGNDWVETRSIKTGDGAEQHEEIEVRLKPLGEFRALVEERGRFLMIEGEEISDKAEGVPVHLNASNLKDPIQPLGGATVREAIAANLRAVEDQGQRTGREILAHLNHPNYGYAVTAEDLAAVLSDKFFEVYNGHPGVNHEGDHHHASVEQIWDIANTIRLAQLHAPPLLGIATDDSHHYHEQGTSRSGRGWVMVRARHLTPESILKAMKQGDVYASSGVVLKDVRFSSESGLLELDIAADGEATFTTDFIGTPIEFDPASEPRADKDGKPLRTTRKYSSQVGQIFATVRGRQPTYKLTGKELYVRAVVTSSEHHPNASFKHQHQQAWTQPVGWQTWLAKNPPAAESKPEKDAR